jgi:uncharacterized protein (DUF488 family)
VRETGTDLYTIGHSTRSLDELRRLLAAFRIACLADVRTSPRSRHAPQFNLDALATSLPMVSLRYVHLPRLGGFRTSAQEASPNGGWRNASFRGFADYMGTEEFGRALDELWELAGRLRTAIMCAEADYSRCHRLLIADAFTARGGRVLHIVSDRSPEPHRMTPFAVIGEGGITYPPRTARASRGAAS